MNVYNLLVSAGRIVETKCLCLPSAFSLFGCTIGVQIRVLNLDLCSHFCQLYVLTFLTDASSPTVKEGKRMENGVLVNEASGKQINRFVDFWQMGSRRLHPVHTS